MVNFETIKQSYIFLVFNLSIRYLMKKKIAIASVLNPVDDVRMYEKFAQSIINGFPPAYEIHILGAPQTINHKSTANHQQASPPIFFYPIASFNRLSKKRWTYYHTFLKTIFEIQPNLLIINSPELLLPALWVKMKLKIPIIYDVKENYFRNILYQNTYQAHWRIPLAWAVRSLEYLSRCWIDFYLLAERHYEKEFSFSKGKSQVIENKYKRMDLETENRHDESKLLTQTKKTQLRNFLYTGTISHTYGTVRAIHFIKKIRHYLPESQLLIKGFCSDPDYCKLLEKEAEHCDFIHLEVSQNPVNHQEIIHSLANADIALLPYLPNKSTENCIPAKMYEYIAHQLPMVVQANSLWESVCAPCKAALFIDFEAIISEETNIDVWVENLKTYPFFSTGSRDFVLWEGEQEKLLKLIRSFLAEK